MLSCCAPDDPGCYLPRTATLSFARWAGACAGIDDIGFRAGAGVVPADLARPLREAVTGVRTLGEMLRARCDLVYLEQSLAAMWRARRGGEVSVRFEAGRGKHASALESEGDWLQLTCVINAIRQFAGRSWAPEEGRLRSCTSPGDEVRRAFSGTCIVTGCALVEVFGV